MNRVLVTGGTGFVGHWLNMTVPHEMQLFNLNHSGYNRLEELRGFDYIFHLAPVSPALALQCAKNNDARFLYCSSGIVYYPVDTAYRKNKVAWEQQSLDSGLDVVIARLFSFFGDGLDADKAQTIFTRQARRDRDISLRNGGNTIRTYMHGSEMGRWLWAVMLRGERGQAYDVGSDTPVTMFELANQIIRQNHSRSRIVFNDLPEAVPAYIPENTQKTRELFR